MKPASVIELRDLLNQVIEQGCGHYLVQVSDDEECNGHHPLYNVKECFYGGVIEYVDSDKSTKNSPTLVFE